MAQGLNTDPGNQWAEKPLSVRLEQIKRQWLNLGPQQLLMLDNLILSAEYLQEQLAMKNEPTPSAPSATSKPLAEDIDAARWAREFIDQFTGYSVGGNTIDEGLMLGWFANAIMAGYDRAQRTRSALSETVPCTLCAAEPGSDGFYTGCMVKDGHAPEWDCDGKGNLTRRSAIEPSADEKRYRWLRRNGDKGIYVIQRWTQGDEHSPLALAQGGELDTIIDEHIAGTR